MQTKSQENNRKSMINGACRCEGQADKSMESSMLTITEWACCSILILEYGDQIAYLQLGADVLQFRFLKNMTE